VDITGALFWLLLEIVIAGNAAAAMARHATSMGFLIGYRIRLGFWVSKSVSIKNCPGKDSFGFSMGQSYSTKAPKWVAQ
jgi:hypothetical protein